ncbi:MAG: hypothetical protein A3D95_11575 [Betaproteobacteria bacterium RIFCSPHIGHO2_12_FULL_69_13]|nr:MAG: hypothetical protein A3D95_11575 [Betaproteobacteria bacterium RIFCSPHIGHO2_12_FULL_69_13]OGA68100.1 MAG: hypothetical protein A3G83_05030 [Betaproteobacteria bacterium RIFCSPLOWO2_12_FULL_68_20]
MIRLAASVFCALLASAAQGAPFADPTRPPNASESDPGSAAAAGPRLESVLIAPNRRFAVISGQTVRVGDTFGEAKVVRITESAVVLRKGEELETLKLIPEVDKRPRVRRAKRADR